MEVIFRPNAIGAVPRRLQLGENYNEKMKDPLSIFAPANRVRLLTLAAVMATVIAVVDWWIKPYVSLGFLYLFPIMIVGGFLSRTQIVIIALIFSVLDFRNFPGDATVVHILFSSAGLMGTGLFVSELVRGRRVVLRHMEELQEQVNLRADAEGQLQVLVDSSPAAIVTIDVNGKILLANQAAQQLLALDAQPLQAQPISSYLPALQTVVQDETQRAFRTALQCTASRTNGEVFLAGVWFSTYTTMSGRRLAAIIVDLSEDLRNREDLSLSHLLKNSRILIGAVAHEVRNLCSAMLVVHKNLSGVKELENNEDFRTLSLLIQSLEHMSLLELGSSAVQNAAITDLTSVLDESRVLIDNAYRESEMKVQWEVSDRLPLVWADRYGLVQVFLNLAKNSQRAMQTTETKRLTVTAKAEDHSVMIRFHDTGVGIANPRNLFRPFQSGSDASGLGLYMSRAIMKSFGGDLRFEESQEGCCFAIVLHSPEGEETLSD